MRLADIERRLENLKELSRIVSAMRSIASMRVQEAGVALASVREYGAQLAEALRDALAIASTRNSSREPPEAVGPLARRALPEAGGVRGRHRVLVLCMSERGFVGAFNERLMTSAEADLNPSDTLLILGLRGAALAEERGHPPAWSASMATRLASVPETVRSLQQRLYTLIANGEVTRVEVIFARYRRGGATEIARRQLFPLAPPAIRAPDGSAQPPLHNLPAAQLIERLTTEYLLAQLLEAAIESLAAESEARFTAMQSANDNVARKLESARLEASRARQEEVTAELLDLIVGTRALEH